MAAIYTDLEGKVVLVTGGGSGIGEAYACNNQHDVVDGGWV